MINFISISNLEIFQGKGRESPVQSAANIFPRGHTLEATFV